MESDAGRWSNETDHLLASRRNEPGIEFRAVEAVFEFAFHNLNPRLYTMVWALVRGNVGPEYSLIALMQTADKELYRRMKSRCDQFARIFHTSYR